MGETDSGQIQVRAPSLNQVKDQDTKHSDRRERNNASAKRSRDRKKMQQDEISFKAAFLEQENAKLKKENISLRRTIEDLKKLLLGLGGVTKESQETQQSRSLPE